jgi:membrane protein implicated in regulation of membrane protease activity
LKLEIGDTVLILDTHPGYDKGRVGVVRGFRKDGHVRVRIEENIWVYVRPENLKVLEGCDKV